MTRERNHPETDGTSCMSPYLHFGHVGPITIALAVDAAAKANPKLQAARDSYFNELIVWRELAINFVRYTPNYDSPECAESWAKTTIAEHARDEREHLYTLQQLENAQTHDELWNAGQIQMVRSWVDAQLPADVLGEEDSGVDAGCGDGDEVCDLSERQVFSRWARSERICGDCVGDAGQVRPGVGRASDLREDSLYVGRVDGEEVRFEEIHRADGASAATGVASLLGAWPLFRTDRKIDTRCE